MKQDWLFCKNINALWQPPWTAQQWSSLTTVSLPEQRSIKWYHSERDHCTLKRLGWNWDDMLLRWSQNGLFIQFGLWHQMIWSLILFYSEVNDGYEMLKISFSMSIRPKNRSVSVLDVFPWEFCGRNRSGRQVYPDWKKYYPGEEYK